MFLDLIWPEIPNHLRALIWTLEDKRSAWLTTAKDAEKAAAKASKMGRNAYFGTGLARIADVEARAKSEGKTIHAVRAESSEVGALYGLAADLDIRNEHHKKQALFPTERVARKFLDDLPMMPSAIVRTGGGLHAHWIFRELWELDEEDEHRLAAAISRGWNGFLRSLANQQGYEIDATWDLARVLRIPGTTNHKHPAKVELIYHEPGRRYNPSDFEAWRLDPSECGPIVGEVVIDPNARPDETKLRALFEIEPRARQSWDHKRKDMADTSPSAYDQSLASFAAIAGWSDQEITDLILWHRKTYDLPPKLHQRYYQLTIAKARGNQSAQELEEEGYDLAPEEVDERRGELLNIIRTKTGAPITRIIRYGQEDAQYWLLLDDGEYVQIGDVGSFVSQAKWEQAVVLAGCSAWHGCTRKEWSHVKRAAVRALEVVPLQEADSIEVFWGWIDEIAANATTIHDPEALYDAMKSGGPIKEDGDFLFQIKYLYDHLRRKRESYTLTDLARRIRQFGYLSQQLAAREPKTGKLINRRYVRIPARDFEERSTDHAPTPSTTQDAEVLGGVN